MIAHPPGAPSTAASLASRTCPTWWPRPLPFPFRKWFTPSSGLMPLRSRT